MAGSHRVDLKRCLRFGIRRTWWLWSPPLGLYCRAVCIRILVLTWSLGMMLFSLKDGGPLSMTLIPHRCLAEVVTVPLWQLINYLPHHCNQIPDRKQLKGGRAYSGSRFKGPPPISVEGMPWRQLALSLVVLFQSMERLPIHCGPLSQVNVSAGSLIENHTHMCVSMAIMNPFKLTVKISHLRQSGKT